jgi:pyrroloquinoline quinone biosynthesis protein E
MDYQHLMYLLDVVKQNDVRLFVLNGGEPLLYPEIIPLLSKIRNMDVAVNIFSSGFGLSYEIVEILKDSKNISFYISLNGSTEKINGLSREGYEIAINAVNMLASANVIYGINWVARHDNTADFPNMLALCRTNKASFLSVVCSKLTGKNELDSPLDKADLEFIAGYINAIKDEEPRILIESCFPMLITLINTPKSGFNAHCYAGIVNCNINCDLSFQPCTHLKTPEKYDTIDEYWHKSVILKTLREHPPSSLAPCNQCSHKRICSLCRAISLDTSIDFTKSSDLCINYSDYQVNNRYMI